MIKTIGIDIGKTIFHLVALDATGHIVMRKRLSRTQLLRTTVNLPPCLIGMEACCGGHYLGRLLIEQGHTVRLIAAQFVRPFVKSNKNDYLDAEAIAEAVQRPTMRFVALKTPEQLDLQALHRVRSRLVGRRTAVINQIRAFLLERGITVAAGPQRLRQRLPWVLEDTAASLSERIRRLIRSLWEEWQQLDEQAKAVTCEIEQIARDDDTCRRLVEIPGVGPLVATALVAAAGNGTGFSSGRDLAAWLGLVPRQHSTGGKPKLLGISKRGNPYLRRLFVQGARSALLHLRRDRHRFGRWLDQLQARAHSNVVAIALANKLARIAWVILHSGQSYRAADATA
jgi:transposase